MVKSSRRALVEKLGRRVVPWKDKPYLWLLPASLCFLTTKKWAFFLTMSFCHDVCLTKGRKHLKPWVKMYLFSFQLFLHLTTNTCLFLSLPWHSEVAFSGVRNLVSVLLTYWYVNGHTECSLEVKCQCVNHTEACWGQMWTPQKSWEEHPQEQDKDKVGGKKVQSAACDQPLR